MANMSGIYYPQHAFIPSYRNDSQCTCTECEPSTSSLKGKELKNGAVPYKPSLFHASQNMQEEIKLEKIDTADKIKDFPYQMLTAMSATTDYKKNQNDSLKKCISASTSTSDPKLKFENTNATQKFDSSAQTDYNQINSIVIPRLQNKHLLSKTNTYDDMFHKELSPKVASFKNANCNNNNQPLLLSPNDILNRIKVAYKACACKVCECIAYRNYPNESENCNCKPCECSDCLRLKEKLNMISESMNRKRNSIMHSNFLSGRKGCFDVVYEEDHNTTNNSIDKLKQDLYAHAFHDLSCIQNESNLSNQNHISFDETFLRINRTSKDDVSESKRISIRKKPEENGLIGYREGLSKEEKSKNISQKPNYAVITDFYLEVPSIELNKPALRIDKRGKYINDYLPQSYNICGTLNCKNESNEYYQDKNISSNNSHTTLTFSQKTMTISDTVCSRVRCDNPECKTKTRRTPCEYTHQKSEKNHVPTDKCIKINDTHCSCVSCDRPDCQGKAYKAQCKCTQKKEEKNHLSEAIFSKTIGDANCPSLSYYRPDFKGNRAPCSCNELQVKVNKLPINQLKERKVENENITWDCTEKGNQSNMKDTQIFYMFGKNQNSSMRNEKNKTANQNLTYSSKTRIVDNELPSNLPAIMNDLNNNTFGNILNKMISCCKISNMEEFEKSFCNLLTNYNKHFKMIYKNSKLTNDLCADVIKFDELSGKSPAIYKKSIQNKSCRSFDHNKVDEFKETKKFIIAPMRQNEDLPPEPQCRCTSCECRSSTYVYVQNGSVTEDTSRDVSTSPLRHPNCHCDICTNDTCIPDGTDTCKCIKRTKVMNKPVSKDVKDYNIQRVCVNKIQWPATHGCKEKNIQYGPMMIPEKNNVEKKCDCNTNCCCIVCSKLSYSTEFKSEKTKTKQFTEVNLKNEDKNNIMIKFRNILKQKTGNELVAEILIPTKEIDIVASRMKSNIDENVVLSQVNDISNTETKHNNDSKSQKIAFNLHKKKQVSRNSILNLRKKSKSRLNRETPCYITANKRTIKRKTGDSYSQSPGLRLSQMFVESFVPQKSISQNISVMTASNFQNSKGTRSWESFSSGREYSNISVNRHNDMNQKEILKLNFVKQKNIGENYDDLSILLSDGADVKNKGRINDSSKKEKIIEKVKQNKNKKESKNKESNECNVNTLSDDKQHYRTSMSRHCSINSSCGCNDKCTKMKLELHNTIDPMDKIDFDNYFCWEKHILPLSRYAQNNVDILQLKNHCCNKENVVNYAKKFSYSLVKILEKFELANREFKGAPKKVDVSKKLLLELKEVTHYSDMSGLTVEDTLKSKTLETSSSSSIATSNKWTLKKVDERINLIEKCAFLEKDSKKNDIDQYINSECVINIENLNNYNSGNEDNHADNNAEEYKTKLTFALETDTLQNKNEETQVLLQKRLLGLKHKKISKMINRVVAKARRAETKVVTNTVADTTSTSSDLLVSRQKVYKSPALKENIAAIKSSHHEILEFKLKNNSSQDNNSEIKESEHNDFRNTATQNTHEDSNEDHYANEHHPWPFTCKNLPFEFRSVDTNGKGAPVPLNLQGNKTALSTETKCYTDETNADENEFPDLYPEMFSEELKVKKILVQRISNHTVIVKWKCPESNPDIVGYELLVDGRSVQKTSPKHSVAVIKSLPSSDNILIAVKTLISDNTLSAHLLTNSLLYKSRCDEQH